MVALASFHCTIKLESLLTPDISQPSETGKFETLLPKASTKQHQPAEAISCLEAR